MLSPEMFCTYVPLFCSTSAGRHSLVCVLLLRQTTSSVAQALTVLEFLIKRGSDQCVENSQVLLSKLEDLQVFEYTSPDGRDHGVNVRHRYATVTAYCK